MSEFFAMSGYAKYVWPSLALGFGVVLLNLVLAWSSLRNAREQARRRLEMQS